MPFSRRTTPTVTLRQPWAALVARGAKPIATRHSRFRGLVGEPIFIHAGRVCDRAARSIAALYIDERELSEFETGATIATASVADAHPLSTTGERDALIKCSSPRFGLVLTDIQPLVSPVPAKGPLGVWYLERAA
jgi:hypothetical protein